MNRAIIILADGARPDVLDGLVKKGDLPNISRYLIEPGCSLPAVTAFPSTTGPAYLPFLTGCLPGTCNVPGIRWFDKIKFDSGLSFDRYRSYVGFESFCMGSDIAPNIKTIFEIVPDSYSIFNPIARGAGSGNMTRMSRIWYWYYGHLTDRWAFVDKTAIKKLKKIQKRSPKFVYAVFPAIDEFSHFSHPNHEAVFGQYRWLDSAVGELVSQLKECGELESTALFLVSDHGLSQTHTHFCVNAFLDKRGLNPFFYPLIFHKRGKLSANMVSGNGMTHVYFKNSDGWARRTVKEELEKLSPGIIDDLINEPAIDVVAVRTANGDIDVTSKRGRAAIGFYGSHINYKVRSSDPFGYPFMQRENDERKFLQSSIDSEYPDAPFQIAHLMESPRSGDIVISATPGYDLRLKYEDPEHKSSHGSIHASHMRVPLISNVRFENYPARTVDIFPTILKLLGYDIPKGIDGMGLEFAG